MTFRMIRTSQYYSHKNLNSTRKLRCGPLTGFLGKFFLLFLFSACTNPDKVKEIKLAHSLDVSHPVHQAIEYMAERTLEKSGGKLKIKIYPNGQLGNERESIELLQIGIVGMTKVSASVMENFAPDYKVFGLPYLFRDKAHFFNVLDGEIGQNLLIEGSRYWLRGLAYYDAGSRSFYSVEKGIYTPEDLKGLKIRVQTSPTAINMVKAFGGSPTPIAWAELYTALQQGIVDGAENNPPSFYTSRHYEVARHYTLNEHTMVPDVLLISTKTWERLDEEEKEWVREAAVESVEIQRRLWREAEEEALQAVNEAGVEIIRPDKSLFAEKVESFYESYRSEPEVYNLIREIREFNIEEEEL